MSLQPWTSWWYAWIDRRSGGTWAAEYVLALTEWWTIASLRSVVDGGARAAAALPRRPGRWMPGALGAPPAAELGWSRIRACVSSADQVHVARWSPTRGRRARRRRHRPATPARCARRAALPSRRGPVPRPRRSPPRTTGSTCRRPRPRTNTGSAGGCGQRDADGSKRAARRATERRSGGVERPRAAAGSAARLAATRSPRRSAGAGGEGDRARCCVVELVRHRGLGDRCDHEHAGHAAERRELDERHVEGDGGGAKHG